MRPFCATTLKEGVSFLSLFLENFLAHSNNANVNFCLDDEDNVVGRENIYLHDWRTNDG